MKSKSECFDIEYKSKNSSLWLPVLAGTGLTEFGAQHGIKILREKADALTYRLVRVTTTREIVKEGE